MNIRWPVFLYILRAVVAQNTNCDFYQDVAPNVSYTISSPRYPNNYTGGIQCRWTAQCPVDYNCRIVCPEIVLPQSPSCSMDKLLVSKSGDPQLSGADSYCGRGSLTSVSTGRSISLGLITSSNSPGGRFRCTLTAQRAASVPPCSCGERRQNRIVGGQETGINEYTMMVGIVDLSIREIKCGAVIISQDYVLTAAHCVRNKSTNSIAVVVGEHDVNTGDSPATQAYRVARILIHSQYSESNYDYDAAIVTTSDKIKFSDRVGPVCLPFKFVQNNEDWLAGKKVTLLGWGTSSFGGRKSNVLMKVDVDVISQSDCRNRVSSLTSRQICTLTAGKDACQDDSGGPALYTDPATGLLFSVGIISYGRSCASNEPGINTRVIAVLDWILANTKGTAYCMK